MSESINCPNCGTEIEVAEALSSRLKAEAKKQLEAERAEREKGLREKEAALKEQEESLAKEKEDIEEAVRERLKGEREELKKQLLSQAKDEVAVELKDRQEELTSTQQKLEEARKAELELRKSKREVEEQKAELELTVARTLDAEREKIREAAKKEAVDERALKDAEKEKLIGDLRKQIDELKRKSEQGSQQLQGEVLELGLEALLARLFPLDSITPVPKGVHGGDVVQEVRDSTGTNCGTILWESKRTKNWSDTWLPKLRDDQRAAKAQVAVLVSIELPADIDNFGAVEGVWVSGWPFVAGLVSVLRQGLIEVTRSKQANEGQQGKMEMLYSYLSGSEFRHRIEGIVEAFVTLQTDLESEKRSLNRIWSKREKQLQRAVVQTAGMYGDLNGIIGQALPVVEHLELPTLDEEHDNDE